MEENCSTNPLNFIETPSTINFLELQLNEAHFNVHHPLFPRKNPNAVIATQLMYYLRANIGIKIL